MIRLSPGETHGEVTPLYVGHIIVLHLKEVSINTRQVAYGPAFKQQIIELHRAGRTSAELAREFGCHKTTIALWVRQAKADELGGRRSDAPLTSAERQELSRLRRELRQVTLERDCRVTEK